VIYNRLMLKSLQTSRHDKVTIVAMMRLGLVACASMINLSGSPDNNVKTVMSGACAPCNAMYIIDAAQCIAVIREARLTTLDALIVPHHRLARSLDDANDHDCTSKCYNSSGKVCLAALLTQFHIT